jgi:hypothetical protein
VFHGAWDVPSVMLATLGVSTDTVVLSLVGGAADASAVTATRGIPTVPSTTAAAARPEITLRVVEYPRSIAAVDVRV